MLKQRAKEFANYLLLGMKRKELTNLFLYEILLLGLFCFLAGTAIGFVLYGLLGFTLFFHSFHISGSLYAESLLHTFFYFSMIEVVSALSLKYRLDKLQKSTGLDLRVFEDAITFKIALMVVKYMKYMESFEY